MTDKPQAGLIINQVIRWQSTLYENQSVEQNTSPICRITQQSVYTVTLTTCQKGIPGCVDHQATKSW